MLSSTVSKLRCPQPSCSSQKAPIVLSVHATKSVSVQTLEKIKISDVWSGHVECPACHSKYPILNGVLVLVEHVRDYLCVHVKGLSKIVADSDIPFEYRAEYLEVKAEWLAEQGDEYIEEDLESERVTALYLMNHYLRATESQNWFKAVDGSPLIQALIAEHWDHGPFKQIEEWITEVKAAQDSVNVVELGCGVGGFARALKNSGFYLGVDSSFASIALARHLNLGAAYPHELNTPGDLLDGAVSIPFLFQPHMNAHCDFIVADLEELPLVSESFDGSIALNTIDMLDDPKKLPQMQFDAVKKGGFAIQSCPYIWHSRVAKTLKAQAPKVANDSAKVVEWMYEKAGFTIQKRENHIPWLFFKHFRQLEVYSVHAFFAVKS
jgi:SAM-dependent methyltransferase